MSLRRRSFAIVVTGLVAGMSVFAPAGADPAPAACPTLGPMRQAGLLGQAAGDPSLATIGVSGLAVSRFDSEPTGEQIAWAVGDRSANELAGTNRVFLFGLDARDGSLAIRYPLDPAGFQDDPVEPTTDTITKLGQTPNPIPDLEDLSIDYAGGGPGQIWLFDTGDNGGGRGNLNAYVVHEPDLATEPETATPLVGAGLSVRGSGGKTQTPSPSPSLTPSLSTVPGASFLTSHPGLDDALTGPALSVVRYPIRLTKGGVQITTNVEAAFVDSAATGTEPSPIYLISKSPVDVDGDGVRTDFPVFRSTTRNTAASGLTNDAGYVGTVSFAQADLKVTAASILDDGSAFVVRAVSGGNLKPDVDVVGLWWRTPDTSIEEEIASGPSPDCTWSLNSAPSSSSEETIALDLTDATSTGFEGLVWTHDVRGTAAPYFTAPRTG